MITSMRLLRWAAATVTSAVLLVLLARASAAPLPYHEGGMARLRLSWSARPERIEVCRALSAEELEREEEHMRQRVECDGRFATYTSRVEADGRLLAESVVRGAGLRHDRPMYVLRDFPLSSGLHRVRISFTRREHAGGSTAAIAPTVGAETDTGLFAGRAEREAVERARRQRAAIPARLVLDTSMVFAPDRVIIVTFNAERRALEALDTPSLPR